MIKIRPSRASDIPLVIDSWAQSYFGAPAIRGCTRDDYFPRMHSYIVRILARVDVKLGVVCVQSDDDVILGWACTEGDVLHYMWTRDSADGMFEPFLLTAGTKVYTHKTKSFTPHNSWAFIPFLAWSDT